MNLIRVRSVRTGDPRGEFLIDERLAARYPKDYKLVGGKQNVEEAPQIEDLLPEPTPATTRKRRK